MFILLLVIVSTIFIGFLVKDYIPSAYINFMILD